VRKSLGDCAGTAEEVGRLGICFFFFCDGVVLGKTQGMVLEVERPKETTEALVKFCGAPPNFLNGSCLRLRISQGGPLIAGALSQGEGWCVSGGPSFAYNPT